VCIHKHVFIDGRKYKATQGTWELLTEANPDRNSVTMQDKQIYKQILIQSNAHRFIYSPSRKIKASKSLKYRRFISPLFSNKRSSLGIVTIIMSLGKIFYYPKHPAGFGSVAKLANASKTNKGIVNEWLSGQNTYTLHKPVRKRNPYTVQNIDDVWEMDLADLSSLSKYNEKYRYLLICYRHIFALCLEGPTKGQNM